MKKVIKPNRDALEFLPGALIEIDISQETLTYMNQLAQNLFGIHPEQIEAGLPMLDIFLNEAEYSRAKELAASFALESYSSNTPYIRHKEQNLQDFWFKKADGTSFFGATQGSFVLDDNQVPVGMILYIRDLTEQKNTERALQESEEQYRTLVEYSSDLIFLINESEEVLSVNKAAAKSIGRDPQEIQGQKISSLFSPKIANIYSASLHKVFLTGEAASYESTLMSRNKKIWIDTMLQPIKHADGKVSAVLGVSRDITARKEAEIKIEESDRLRELLLDVVTHDLKTPASVIYGLSDMAREYLPEDEVIESIYLSSERLIGVLENTSVLSRAVFGEEIPKTELSLKEMIQNIGTEFASQLDNAGMVLEMRVPEQIVIKANPLVGEVFKNYISNAIKYGKDGKKIVVEALEENKSVIVGVKDFGRTIPVEKRKLIFERGSQLAKSKKQGRGLAIVKRIARAHGADVGIEANNPQGNIFYLRLNQDQTG